MKSRSSGQPFRPCTGVDDVAGDARISGACILVVDDIELNRLLINAYLEEDGFENILFAVDGADALAKIEQHRPDLVILDLLMPKVDGFAVLQEVRNRSYANPPAILVQTAMSEQEQRVRVFDIGATDLVTKPITAVELRARVRLHLENRFLLQGLRKYHERLNKDLQLARQMQEGLLPPPQKLDDIEARYGVQVRHDYASSDELGGDFWGLRAIDNTRLFFYITDFAGHGITAALNTFRLHSTIMQRDHSMSSPASYLSHLNDHMCRLLPPGQFATMLCGVIDVGLHVITYAAAASTPPLLGYMGNEDVLVGDPSGIPLGIQKGVVYEDRVLPFKKDAIFFLYSDALTESPDHDGQLLGDKGLQKMMSHALSKLDNKTSDARFLKMMMAEFNERVPRPLPDDLTAVSFRHL